jgi:crotonobetainyl-CoA:carnitine CoA-transferase CaiB-like acyl-CoA transferase
MPRAATLDSARGKYLLSSTRFDDLDQALGNSRVTLSNEEERVSMDLRKEEGKTVLPQLIQVSDVLVQNFRPGTIEEMGLGWEVLKTLNEDSQH